VYFLCILWRVASLGWCMGCVVEFWNLLFFYSRQSCRSLVKVLDPCSVALLTEKLRGRKTRTTRESVGARTSFLNEGS